MICPHCKKIIDLQKLKEEGFVKRVEYRNKILSKLLKIIKKKPISIADLQRQTGIKRSTLNYYLNLLEIRTIIIRKRIQKKVTGRPTLISINPKLLNNVRKK